MSSSGKKSEGVAAAGVTIFAGDVVSKNAEGTFVLADANSTAALANARGIALNEAAPGQPFDFCYEDTELSLGTATLVVGKVYAVSSTPGKMIANAELLTGDRVTVLGVAVATNKLHLKTLVSTAVIP
jgi:hypothetical protein